MDSEALAEARGGVSSFLAPFAEPNGRSERREGAALYIEGLLLPGERKSIEPMAERLGVDSQKLQAVCHRQSWEAEAVWRVIRREFPGALGTHCRLDRR